MLWNLHVPATPRTASRLKPHPPDPPSCHGMSSGAGNDKNELKILFKTRDYPQKLSVRAKPYGRAGPVPA